MENKKKKRQTVKISVFITSIFVIFMSVTYAFITQVLTGEKQVVINAGVLDLVLEEENEITISDAYPMYDEVGMIQEDVFKFRLVNKTGNDTNYILKLQEIETGTLDKSIVKYGFIKEEEKKIDFVSNIVDGVIDTGTIEGNDTIDYELRLWIDSSVTELTQVKSKFLKLGLSANVSERIETIKQTVTFAGITKEVSETTETMFNYTSEGCILDMSTNKTTCPIEATNGIYRMEDDDNLSYFYRGEVDNLVKFGSYTKDYYVYRDNDREFASLDACKYNNPSCSETNKVLKYAASDNVPMYWRIVRINGDGTIRMIYAGTSVDAKGYDTGIGLSQYNNSNNRYGYSEKKYLGYTYDRTTEEIDSGVKQAIDEWYSSMLEGTVYDSRVEIGKFCNDTSIYGDIVDNFGDIYNVFDSVKRLKSINYPFENNVSPTFKCPATTETYGGIYNLKAGLITADEIVAAGGGNNSNNSYYLYNGTKGNNDGVAFFSMTPKMVHVSGDSYVTNIYSNGSLHETLVASSLGAGSYLYSEESLLRPVINLKSNVVFKSGTDGSKTNPYEIELGQ